MEQGFLYRVLLLGVSVVAALATSVATGLVPMLPLLLLRLGIRLPTAAKGAEVNVCRDAP